MPRPTIVLTRLAFVFSSQSFNQAFKRLRYLQEYSQFRQKQVEEIKLAEQKLSDELLALKRQKVLLTVAKNEKIQSLESSQIEVGILDSEQSSQKTLLSKLRKKEKQLKKELQSKQRLAKELDKQIRKIIEEEIRLAKAKASKESDVLALTPEEQELADNFTSNKGKLPWPVSRGVVIQRFGTQPHPVVKTAKIKSNGIVIATEKSAKVKTVFKGQVLSVLKFRGSNPTILIQHGNYITAYKNLSKVFVSKGDVLESGQAIGEVFTNKTNSQSTIQFSIFKKTTPLNPLFWILKM